MKFFNGGFCRQLFYLVDRKTWRWGRFQAVFLAIAHPRLGWVLVDTGYGSRFKDATRRFPHRFYRWATPATCPLGTAEQLRLAGIEPEAVRHVIMTHFHADHAGGLADFPHARVHYHEGALSTLQSLSPLRQVRAAFLPELMPTGFAQQSDPVAAAAFAHDEKTGLRTLDLFQDGTVHLVDLPGHAPGHLGVLLETSPRPLLYAADAYWLRTQLTEGVTPLALAMAMQWSPPDYLETITRLRVLLQKGTYEIAACHCPETQRHVEASH